MKASEMREKGPEALKSVIDDLKKGLFESRFSHATGQLEQTSELRRLRRNIARANTILREFQKQDQGA